MKLGKKAGWVVVLFLLIGQSVVGQENSEKSEGSSKENLSNSCTVNIADSVSRKGFDKNLPTVGILVFDGVLMTEVTAPIDVFSKSSVDGKKRFNVAMVAQSMKPIAMETGVRVLPDYTFKDCPKLDVVIVPSSFEMAEVIKSPEILDFVRSMDKGSKFTMSNCAGAYLIGASGVGNGKKIVTYIGGGKKLQSMFPKLTVQDDSKVSFVKDGKLVSSNGNLASYLSALKVLEEMTSKEHRKSVEERIYIDRLRNREK